MKFHFVENKFYFEYVARSLHLLLFSFLVWQTEKVWSNARMWASSMHIEQYHSISDSLQIHCRVCFLSFFFVVFTKNDFNSIVFRQCINFRVAGNVSLHHKLIRKCHGNERNDLSVRQHQMNTFVWLLVFFCLHFFCPIKCSSKGNHTAYTVSQTNA